MATGGVPAGCTLEATGVLMRELLSWFPGRPPSLETRGKDREEGEVMLTEEGACEEVLLLMGGGEVIVGEL